jgi:hypothetical protein
LAVSDGNHSDIREEPWKYDKPPKRLDRRDCEKVTWDVVLNGGLGRKVAENVDLNESSAALTEDVSSWATDVRLMYIRVESKRPYRSLPRLLLCMSRECRTGILVSLSIMAN